MSTRESLDTIVVGGGLAGLAAATLLAKAGRAVRVLERASHVGGRAQTRVESGFRLNLGPHALYRRGPGARVLAELGVAYRGHAPATRGLALCDGQVHPLPVALGSLARTSLLTVPDKLRLARLMVQLPRLDLDPWRGKPFAAWLASQPLGVRALLRALGRLTTYADEPERMDAAATLAQLQEAIGGGVVYLDGGWQSLVDGLHRAASEAGAIVECEGAVTRVFGHKQVEGVELSRGGMVRASQVVLALDAASVAKLCRDAAPRLAAEASAATPVLAACLDVGLSHLPRPCATFALGIDQPLYVSVHSAAASLAPPGGALVHVLKYLGASSPGEASALSAELEAALDLVQPGWRSHVVVRQALPRMVAASALAVADVRGLGARPGVASEECRGLFVAGDWVGSEGLLADAALASAAAAARAALAAAQRGVGIPREMPAAPPVAV